MKFCIFNREKVLTRPNLNFNMLLKTICHQFQTIVHINDALNIINSSWESVLKATYHSKDNLICLSLSYCIILKPFGSSILQSTQKGSSTQNLKLSHWRIREKQYIEQIILRYLLSNHGQAGLILWMNWPLSLNKCNISTWFFTN